MKGVNVSTISSKTILITDDNQVSVQFMDTILKKNGYQTVSALNAKDCLKYAVENQPDLILLDISMPETSGIEVCKKLRQTSRTNHIPIIFVTANTDDSVLSTAFEAGGTDYVRKPVNRIELLARIKSVLVNQELTIKRVQEEKLQGILEMAGAVCHELNQPLQLIAGYTELSLTELSQDDPMFESITKIKVHVDKMGEITKKLMGITSYETKHYGGRTKIVDIDRSSGRNND